VLYTIITQEDRGYGGEVLYFAVKCTLSPKSSSKTRSAEIYQIDNTEKVKELLKSAKIERKRK